MKRRFAAVSLLTLALAASSFAMDRMEKDAIRQRAMEEARMGYQAQSEGSRTIDSIVPMDDATILVVINTPLNSWQLSDQVHAVFESLYMDVAYWDAAIDGPFDTDYLTMYDWDAVMLFADDTGEFPTRAYDGGAWSQYVIDGGNLFYSDQDYFWANNEVSEPVFSAGDFAYDAFGIESGLNDAHFTSENYFGQYLDPMSGEFFMQPFYVNEQQAFNWEDAAYPVVEATQIFFNGDNYDATGHMYENQFGGKIAYTAFNAVASAELIDNQWEMTHGFVMLVENAVNYFMQPDEATLALMPADPFLPAEGGDLTYDVRFINNTANSYPAVSFWTTVTLPNGNMTGALSHVYFNVTPNMNTGLSLQQQMVPPMAPEGQYTFHAHVGMFPMALVNDSFQFFKEAPLTGSGSGEYNEADWMLNNAQQIAADAPAAGTLPGEFALNAAYPNPFNPTTTVSVSLPEAADLTVAVYNTIGQQVAELAQGRVAAGTHAYTFDASALSSGVYFVHATVPGQLNAMQKVVLMK
ncbi:T9SS type A sorting domain-containing protein [bacterium]|nr:T9SS type A sorting domain-containing protein [bacterium]